VVLVVEVVVLRAVLVVLVVLELLVRVMLEVLPVTMVDNTEIPAQEEEVLVK
jgi:hypothetical protein